MSNNKIHDIRDFLSQNKFNQSENNIKYKNTNNTSNLDIMNWTNSALKSEISSSNETSSQPLAKPVAEIVCIGASLHEVKKNSPDRRKISVSITWDNAKNKQFTAALTHFSRKRELKGTLPNPEYKKWWGYNDALDFISNLPDTENSYIGKLKYTSNYKAGTPQIMPIVPETAVVHWLDDQGIHVMFWLGDNQYLLELNSEHLNKKQQQFYIANGYWKPMHDIVCEKMF